MGSEMCIRDRCWVCLELFYVPLVSADTEMAEMSGMNGMIGEPAPYSIPPHAMMGMAVGACPYPDAKVATCINMAVNDDEDHAVALGLKIKASDTIHIKITGAKTDNEAAAANGFGVAIR